VCKANQAPASIEGLKLLVKGQDIKPSGLPRPSDNPEEMVFPLSVYKRGASSILQEYSPKTHKFLADSFLDKGSEIAGPYLWGFSSSLLDRDSFDIGGKGRTASHPGQSVVIEGTCLMTIVKGWRGLPLPRHPKSALLK
jgi:hypothetical protein